MRNAILITLLTLLLTASAFSAVVRVGDTPEPKKKEIHPFLKLVEEDLDKINNYMTKKEGVPAEIKFKIYVLSMSPKECMDSKTKKNPNPNCFPARDGVKLHRAVLTPTSVLKRIDNCTILPFMTSYYWKTGSSPLDLRNMKNFTPQYSIPHYPLEGWQSYEDSVLKIIERIQYYDRIKGLQCWVPEGKDWQYEVKFHKWKGSYLTEPEYPTVTIEKKFFPKEDAPLTE